MPIIYILFFIAIIYFKSKLVRSGQSLYLAHRKILHLKHKIMNKRIQYY
jgi:hypothetical protein